MQLPAIKITQEALFCFEDAIKKEWLITNRIGGYASSTVLGINTRKYHGLLIAALHPPRERTVCLSKLDEEISIDNNIYRLGANEFQSEIFPQGYMFLKEVSISPFPRFRYMLPNVEFEKTIFMPNKKNAIITAYKILNKNNFNVKIRIFPFLSCRYYHSVVDKQKNPPNFVQSSNGKMVEIQANFPKVTLLIEASTGQFRDVQGWIERIYYREDSVRGASSFDDYYQPGYFEILAIANKREEFAVVTVADKNRERAIENLDWIGISKCKNKDLLRRELESRKTLLTQFYKINDILKSDWLSWVLQAIDNSIVTGIHKQKTVMAGYFWFEDWGRDTFISLPGLMLITRRFDDAKKVFLEFLKHFKQGLIPNFIQEKSGDPAYNSVDATLWFVNSVLQFLKYSGDFRFVQEKLWENLKAIVENFEKGAEFGIYVDNDGLLAHGPQLTWMDAEVEGKAITPRGGKAVEIQALWYNALRTAQFLANNFEEKRLGEKYGEMAEKTRESFVEKFWNSEKNCLYDVISEYGNDASLRPNQIIGVAIDFNMLDKDENEKIVDLVHHELSTPYGLRTLARNDPKYLGVYVGDRITRDKAYHNGTVWPWLQGPFITAFLKTKGYANCRKEYALKKFIMPLFSEIIFKAGLGNISEIFDGDPPYIPRGCIAQTWSIAEPLRAYVEDIKQTRPKYEKMMQASF